MKRLANLKPSAYFFYGGVQWVVLENNDKIGAIFFSDKVEKFIPPKKGRKHILFLIRELIDFSAREPWHRHRTCCGIFHQCD